MTAIDTALIDNASIGGFMFGYTGDVDEQGRPIGILMSQNEKLVLDARTGKLSCIDADVDGNINVGSLRLKTQSSSGVLDGFSMGIGDRIYTLPILNNGENMEIKLLNPRVESRVPSNLFKVQVDPIYMSGSLEGKAIIVVPDEDNTWAKTDTSTALKDNILYTLFGYCNSNGYSTWYIGGSYGSTASLPISSSGGVEFINSISEVTKEGVLYVMG
jgi:hypothetical protein